MHAQKRPRTTDSLRRTRGQDLTVGSLRVPSGQNRWLPRRCRGRRHSKAKVSMGRVNLGLPLSGLPMDGPKSAVPFGALKREGLRRFLCSRSGRREKPLLTKS